MKDRILQTARMLDKQRISLDSEIRGWAIKSAVNSVVRDAVPAALMQRALQYAVTQGIMLQTTYTVWRDIFPIDSDMPAGADTKIFTIWENSGMAEWYRGGGKHPNVAVGKREVSIPFHSLTEAFTVDWLEMLGSGYAGVNVEAEKAAAALAALDRKVENIVFLGDSSMNRLGLLDHTNITTANMTTGTWSTATAAEIIADLQYGINAVCTQAKDDEDFQNMQVDVMMDPSNYRTCTSKLANSYTNENIEQVLRKLDGKFGRFINSPKHGSYDSGTNVTFGPFSDASSNVVSISMDRERMPADNRGSFIEQPFVTKLYGYHLKYPLRFWQGNNG